MDVLWDVEALMKALYGANRADVCPELITSIFVYE